MAEKNINKYYFSKYEERVPPPPVPYSPWREALFQFLATLNIGLGGWYITWRWTSSLNPEAMWFSVTLALAETAAYIGMVLFSINMWYDREFIIPEAPEFITDCVKDPSAEKRPISIDVFFPTYNEDIELVRLSIKDAKKITYPFNIDIKIHVLDDGKREEMKKVAEEEGVNYITRNNNAGFKAGNLQNAMEQTYGDFIVICDADTRPFPTILAHTLGYFRDSHMAWVQTPQWFFDIPEGERLPLCFKKKLGLPGELLGKMIETFYGPTTIGDDPLGNDPKLFYEVILKRRDVFNASFCCGAGSIHRREAVMEAALKRFSRKITDHVDKFAGKIEDKEIKEAVSETIKREMIEETPVSPYMYHVSEDIYTSIILHSDPDRKWKSVLHPMVESKMLSPQDLLTWVIQRFKYAGGSLDIMLSSDCPLFLKGLSFWQKVMYMLTGYSYFACIWNIIFLLAPLVYLYTGIAPVSAYSFDFFKHIFLFLIVNRLVIMVGTWGIDNWRAEQIYMSFFPVNLQAIKSVLAGEKIKFHVTPKLRQEGSFLHLIKPQIAIIILTMGGIIFSFIRLFMGWNSEVGGVIMNSYWGLLNVALLMGIVRAALWKPDEN